MDEIAFRHLGSTIVAMERTPRIVYQQGDHVCTLFSSREEQLTAAIEYVRGGLERGERCLYVCG